MNFGPLIVLLVLFFFNVPITMCLFASAASYFLFTDGFQTYMIFQKAITQCESFTLLAVPFFVAVGVIMNYAGISKRLMAVADMLTGRMVGGLAQSNIVLSTLMGGVSGSANADAAMEAKVLVPIMEEHGYSKGFSAGVTACSSIITPTIPPGIGLILYASLANQSVGDMFLAGYGPGVFMMVCLMLMTRYVSKRKNYTPSRAGRLTAKACAGIVLEGIWALFIPLGLIMGLRMGLFTPTEAGAVCVFYCIFVGVFIYRELTWAMIPKIIRETVEGTAGIMALICGAAAFGNYLSWENIPRAVSTALITLTDNKYILLLLINVMLLVVGMFLEGTASLIIMTPILLPAVTALGVSPLQFGIMMCVNVTIGGVTPPFGTLLFSTCSIVGCSVEEFVRESWQLMLALLVCLLGITYIPAISTFLPGIF